MTVCSFLDANKETILSLRGEREWQWQEIAAWTEEETDQSCSCPNLLYWRQTRDLKDPLGGRHVRRGTIRDYNEMILDLHQQELTPDEIGKIIHYSPRQVSRFLAEKGVPLNKKVPHQGTIRDHAARILALHQQRWPHHEIGDEIQYSRTAVQRLLAEIGDPSDEKGLPREIREKHEKVFGLLDEGLTPRQIAIKMQLDGDDYSESYIYELRKKQKRANAASSS